MRYFVKVRSAARKEKIEKTDKNSFIVSVKEPPVKGKANKAVIKIMAEYFGVAVSRVKIVSGFTSKQKVVKII